MEESYKFAEGQKESWMKAKTTDQLCDFLEFVSLHITNKSVINDVVQIFLFLEQVNQKLISDQEFLAGQQNKNYIYSIEKDTILNRKIRELLVLIEQDIQKFLCEDREMLTYIQKELDFIQNCCISSIIPFKEQIIYIVSMVYSALTTFENTLN
ncbi:hypothetical protein TTHERM_00285420 (macronuclear) [Tetrahymena thermophila SB210]|uniref:Uncharacterized protein n=1 Tax=Tetrahymena thermophila (strain SB210) TaxID=312017 RepID=I7MKF1_TETTS|nr:hypothetical protein TTHERM_00285420 [Tetrahymena thermophila SB210]EAR98311.1 hypothetical protein TTHERM_00285420 [Tetrahymena thermophila SB210]|eukprot:XP_001018556.1 hypothetical protein TTHERM_00285420 [Tetrahymena thermophila SB210]